MRGCVYCVCRTLGEQLSRDPDLLTKKMGPKLQTLLHVAATFNRYRTLGERKRRSMWKDQELPCDCFFLLIPSSAAFAEFLTRAKKASGTAVTN